jgi:hypothetical protein
MGLLRTVSDIIEEVNRLLDTPDLSDWTPPDGSPDDQAKAELEELDRRHQARVDAYLEARDDKLFALRALRSSCSARAEEYKALAEPWLRLAKRKERLAAYVEQRARDLLMAERIASGLEEGEPYQVVLLGGIKVGLRKSPPSVKVINVAELPGSCTKTEVVAVKAEIAKRLKAGQVVPGAELVMGEHVHWGR